MILTALSDYYQRLLRSSDSGVAAPGYSQERISYAIVLDENGQVVEVNDLRSTEGKEPIGRLMSVPASFKRPGTGSKSFFLWDKTSYALGIGKNTKRASQDHDAFKALHRLALSSSDDPGLKALLAFLEGWAPQKIQECVHFVRHGQGLLDTNVVFRLSGDRQYLHEREASREAWSRLQEGQGGAARAMCLVTGQFAPIARLHPAIKGVNNAQSSGASIVSFNLDAFTSYGKAQGENAPVSEQAAFAYCTALNHLLRRDECNRQRLQIGDTTVVFWAQAADPDEAAGAEDVLALMLGGAERDEQATGRLHELLQQVRQMHPLRELGGNFQDGTRIFVLGLAPNASRLSIRFWETGTLGTFTRRLVDHYRDLELHPLAWRRAPSPWLLALQTAPIRSDKGKPKADDVPPLLAGELTRAILTGNRYPRSLLGNILMRFRADGQISPLRVALCKGVLARNARLDREQGESSHKGAPPVSLDPNYSDPGYLLGRLFSTLENAQRIAFGKNVNATIRDRYYGAASATPASIFPVLLRNAQNHLAKLRKDKAGLAVNLEKEIGQIIDALPPTLPRSLSIEEQGRFAIGYYHQTQSRFARNDAQDVVEPEVEGETA